MTRIKRPQRPTTSRTAVRRRGVLHTCTLTNASSEQGATMTVDNVGAVPLSPEEIESRDFLVDLRGYDKEQVHAFLKEVAADYRAVTAALAAAQDDAGAVTR